MKRLLLALFCGFIFGLGLSLSQMINPEKVIAFLDVTGNWDPSLAFVMAGALAVTLISFRRIPLRASPILDTEFKLPVKNQIDRDLIGGAAIFGLGWGMIGYCPGPVVAALGIGLSDAVIVMVSLLLGFFVHKILFDRNL